MQSLAEILLRLVAFLEENYPDVAIGPETDIRGRLDSASPAAWVHLVDQINNLDWVRLGHMSLSSTAAYQTVLDIAKGLFRNQRVNFPSPVFDTIPRRRVAKKMRLGRVAKKAGSGRRPIPSFSSDDFVARAVDPIPGSDPFDLRLGPPPGKASLNYPLWYGTNRQPNDPDNLAKGFSGKRGSTVHLGRCVVYVPESHIIGSTGSSWWKRLITGVDDRLKLRDIEDLSSKQFWTSVSSQLKKLALRDRDAVVFIHGYNVSFKDAALRAAQLGTDLDIKSCMAFYSWPSKGKTGGYVEDEAAIEASESFITKFLTDFAERSGAAKIHIIAHSMGNRGVLRAVNRIASTAAKRSGKPFHQIILAAPDVDADTFRELCEAYGKVSRRTTLYVSSRDRAVEAARWLHGFARAGLLPPIMIAPKIDTVNVTNADITLLGHGYVAEARDVLADIHALLRFGTPPTKRFGLRLRKSEDGKTYWLIGK